ncbi:hypothetical protein [uncultured Bacteroides sp.]|uniref:hypothetical protein n=1 Tax=uncultured Bacteroides sp. TaxID=162156 RepID=UPI0025E3B9AD|nr:hypothetical protein [uncultured Bacteroides sp.]
MSIASDVNVPCERRRYSEDGMPASGISGVILFWFICKHFATALAIGKIGVFRSIFSRRQHAGTETADSAATGNTDCQKIRAE